ncbi:MAG: response regulator, partial [Acidobacteriota bacterium]
VILDAILTGETGYEICERFKQHEKALPVLFLTGIDMEESRDLALRVGCDGYLAKGKPSADLHEKQQLRVDTAELLNEIVDLRENERRDDSRGRGEQQRVCTIAMSLLIRILRDGATTNAEALAGKGGRPARVCQ